MYMWRMYAASRQYTTFIRFLFRFPNRRKKVSVSMCIFPSFLVKLCEKLSQWLVTANHNFPRLCNVHYVFVTQSFHICHTCFLNRVFFLIFLFSLICDKLLIICLVTSRKIMLQSAHGEKINSPRKFTNKMAFSVIRLVQLSSFLSAIYVWLLCFEFSVVLPIPTACRATYDKFDKKIHENNRF